MKTSEIIKYITTKVTMNFVNKQNDVDKSEHIKKLACLRIKLSEKRNATNRAMCQIKDYNF